AEVLGLGRSRTAPAIGEEKASSMVEQLVEGSAAMVARDIGVKVEPDALDAIVVWAVGRQEVEDHAPPQRRERACRDLAGVNDVVVEDEVNAPRSSVPTHKMEEEPDEE